VGARARRGNAGSDGWRVGGWKEAGRSRACTPRATLSRTAHALMREPRITLAREPRIPLVREPRITLVREPCITLMREPRTLSRAYRAHFHAGARAPRSTLAPCPG